VSGSFPCSAWSFRIESIPAWPSISIATSPLTPQAIPTFASDACAHHPAITLGSFVA
jgi:hypothetical protein